MIPYHPLKISARGPLYCMTHASANLLRSISFFELYKSSLMAFWNLENTVSKQPGSLWWEKTEFLVQTVQSYNSPVEHRFITERSITGLWPQLCLSPDHASWVWSFAWIGFKQLEEGKIWVYTGFKRERKCSMRHSSGHCLRLDTVNCNFGPLPLL